MSSNIFKDLVIFHNHEEIDENAITICDNINGFNDYLDDEIIIKINEDTN